MKRDLILTFAAVLGSASAGVHKMKLKKIPLSEQLVRHPNHRDYLLLIECRSSTICKTTPKHWVRSTWVFDLKATTSTRCSETRLIVGMPAIRCLSATS